MYIVKMMKDLAAALPDARNARSPLAGHFHEMRAALDVPEDTAPLQRLQ